MATPQEVADYLLTLKEMREAVPVRVTIGSVVYEGARFNQNDNGSRYYLLGDRPTHRRHSVYKLDGGEWFMGGYYDGHLDNPEMRQFHPMGKYFLLIQWTAKEPIDQDVRGKPWDRIPIIVENL